MKAVIKLAPHSSLKFVIGLATKAILSTAFNATINSVKITPIIMNGTVM